MNSIVQSLMGKVSLPTYTSTHKLDRIKPQAKAPTAHARLKKDEHRATSPKECCSLISLVSLYRSIFIEAARALEVAQVHA